MAMNKSLMYCILLIKQKHKLNPQLLNCNFLHFLIYVLLLIINLWLTRKPFFVLNLREISSLLFLSLSLRKKNKFSTEEALESNEPS